MNNTRRGFKSYLDNMSLAILAIFFVTFPVLFLSITTDAFVLPKQLALIFSMGLFFLFFILKSITAGKLSFRTSPFDLPVFIFIVAALLSAIFSYNRYDSLIAFVPLLFIVLLYYGMVNVVRGGNQLLVVLSSLVVGGVISSIVSIASFFKVYILPFNYTHVQGFTTFGSLLDQAIYFALMLPIAGYFAYSAYSASRAHRTGHATPFQAASAHRESKGSLFLPFSIASVIMAVALVLTVTMLLTTNKPLILPFETGLQTGFAAISQDSGNVIKSFILGSGLGTYLTDFTRFKAATFNNYTDLWSFTFFRSSTFVLELLATVGLLGALSFIFIVYRVIREKSFFLPLLLAIVAAFVLPFSFTPTLILFIMLGVFAITRIYNNPDRFPEIEFYFTSFKKHVAGEVPGERAHVKRYGRVFSFAIALVLIVIVAGPLYFVARFFVSDLTFQKSLVAASQNKGLDTYNLQIAAIQAFPYRDVYYRGFSQTNLALANALVLNQKPGTQPSAETQKNILTLIQQSINAGRTATAISPITAFNWNNLSSIYRSLIGFGENADQFTVLTAQQAIALDPNNPQQYVELGGIYYQLGAYDEAIRQFQQAIVLKRDYANAYYNLGHAFEAKGDLQTALSLYETVKQLVAKDPENTKQINKEIDALKAKTKNPNQANSQSSASQSANVNAQDTANQEALDVNRPDATLPERDPRVKIPAPTVSPAASPTKAPQPTPNL